MSNFKDDQYGKAALVDTVIKEKLPYEVTPITDINQWRLDRKKFENDWQKEYIRKQTLARQTAHDAVANQNKQLSFSDVEQQEILYRKTRDDDYTHKPRDPNMWRKNADLKQFHERMKWLDQPKEVYVPTFWEQITTFITKFFSQAFEK